jgi:hypothetical protein
MQKEFEKKMVEKFGKMTIQEIEADAKLLQTSFNEQQGHFYERLYYLKFSNRFRENAHYKKTPWAVYLRDLFHISEPVYTNMKNALFGFPEESKALGAGLVASVSKKCGPEKAPAVLKKIMKIPQKSRTHPKIEKIIAANLRPSEKRRLVKPSYTDLEKEIVQLKMALESETAANVELSKQIIRLKAAAESKVKIDFSILEKQDHHGMAELLPA